MALQKQAVPINFSKGLDLKSDPKQIQPGSFLALSNSVFDKTGLLTKRNGFGGLTPLPAGTNASYLTTFNGNLTAVGKSLTAYSQGSATWLNKGTLDPLSLSTLPIIRNTLNQSYADSVAAINNIVCTVYTETNGSSTVYKYVVSDGNTGQNILPPGVITGNGTVTYAPKVFLLGSFFVIMFNDVVGGVNRLTYRTISTSNPQTPSVPVAVSTNYAAGSHGTFDGYVANNTLYFAWPATTGGGQIRVSGLTYTLQQTNTYISTTGYTATHVSVTADITGSSPVVYVTTFDSGTSLIKTFALDHNLNATLVLAPTTVPMGSGTPQNITTLASNQLCTILAEKKAVYSYDTAIQTDFINYNTVTQSGTLGTAKTSARSIGLASKAFSLNNTIYYLGVYGGPQGQTSYQPSYFLMNLSGQVISRVAYQNGGNYYVTGLPGVSVLGQTVKIPYLYKDLIQAVNKNTNIPTGSQTAGIYSQTGINLASFTFGTDNLLSSEIGNNLLLTGGFISSYDGYQATEQNFFLYPEYVEATYSAGGALAAQQYYYQVTYEWTDNQGNAQRSAPSIPILVDSTNVTISPIDYFAVDFAQGAMTIEVGDGSLFKVGMVITDDSTPAALSANTYIVSIAPSTTFGNVILTLNQPTATASGHIDTIRSVTVLQNTINIPTLRLTYKLSNPVKIVIYRWSTAQQEYYQVTSITSPLLNDPTIDSVQFVDGMADYQILGNNLIYTTGGVIENIAPPSSDISTLYQSRYWVVNAEDPNSLLYSKQVIEATPVEMSDLLSIYVAPTIGGQGSTGDITALSVLDDKLIIFKKNAIYYINGLGPDNTGANSQFTDPTFITATVGSMRPKSIVFMPNGLMFQSDKGIWLLGRDLSTNYIGAPVEKFNNNTVVSAINIPGTNQVRFTLDNGITLMYDYYFQQWGSFVNIPAVSSTLYQNLHTYVDTFGQVFQETVGKYLDNSSPTLLSFTTGWMNLGGLQGFERAYFFYLLAEYASPHKLQIQIAYDYAASPTQTVVITPDNYSQVYGGSSVYGDTPTYGGKPNLEQWRVFFNQQKCQAFQISIQEIYDGTYAVPPGAGLTISGLDMVVGMKKGYPTLRASRSVG